MSKKEDGLSDLAFRKEPALQHVFAMFNMGNVQHGFPSSASAERMFFMGKDVLHAKRASLRCQPGMECLVFVKGKRHLAWVK